MKILDLKKELKYLYAPSAKKVEIVQVPRLQFAMIDGAIEKGSEPGKSPSFAEATKALYESPTHSSSCSRIAKPSLWIIPLWRLKDCGG